MREQSIDSLIDVPPARPTFDLDGLDLSPEALERGLDRLWAAILADGDPS